MASNMIEFIFQAALHGKGEAYLAAEAELIKAKGEAGSYLANLPKREDPFQAAIVELLRLRVAGNVDFIRCLDFFDQTEAETAPTVQGEPTPEWVAGRLLEDFKTRLALLLGVYAVKLEAVWPFWKTVGSLLYLGHLPARYAAFYLLEFILASPSGHYRSLARQALLEMGEADTLAMVAARLETAEATAMDLRQLLADLETRDT
jgi:hypothetical protein